MSSSSESHGTHDLNTPTDNLEAGAGDLVERLLDQADHVRLGIACKADVTVAAGHLVDRAREAAAQLAAVTAENARLRGQTYLASAEAAEHHRDNAITMWHDEKAKRETAEAQLKVAREVLQAFVTNFAGMEDGDGNEAPELIAARALLSQEAPK